MAVPTTVPDLTERLRLSGLIPADRLDGFLAGLRASGLTPASPRALLDQLVPAGMITPFHADRLAAGKYKGFQLGNYLILDQLGVGGMGQVYLAEHAAMRRLVALKVLPVFSTENEVARERFFREARAAAALNHPNVVRVFDLCQDGRLLYLVMEYVEGVSLQSLVGRAGPLPVAAACHYARQVASGLHHAHHLGFVHRDIKPSNLLLDRAGAVKILDFGLVRSEADSASGLTQRLDSKSILGTADYVAPEQAVDSSKVDIRADLYSLGATLYFLLAGRPLFPEGRTAQKLVWQQIKNPVALDRLRPEVSGELAAVVHTLLEKRAGDRYQTPAEVFDALEPWDAGDVLPPDDDLIPRPSPRVQSCLAAAAGSSPRVSGSTSQILALAMRSGGGSSGAHRRPEARGSHVLSGNTPRETDRNGSNETDAVAMDQTRRTPTRPPRRRRPGGPVEPQPSRSKLVPGWAIITAAAVATALIGVGLAVLVSLG